MFLENLTITENNKWCVIECEDRDIDISNFSRPDKVIVLIYKREVVNVNADGIEARGFIAGRRTNLIEIDGIEILASLGVQKGSELTWFKGAENFLKTGNVPVR